MKSLASLSSIALVALTVAAPQISTHDGAARGRSLPVPSVSLAGYQNPNALKGSLQAQYDAMSTLVMRRDGAGLTKFLDKLTATDFAYVDKKGRKQNRTELIKQMQGQMKLVKRFTKSSNKIVAFATKGNAAVCRVVSDFSMTFPGQNGKPSVITGQSTSIDTWKKIGNAWKLAKIAVVKENVKMNGKPV